MKLIITKSMGVMKGIIKTIGKGVEAAAYYALATVGAAIRTV